MAKLASFFSEHEWQSLRKKSKIIPMGITSLTQESSQQHSSGTLVLFMGRLAEKKGVQYLLPAFAKFLENDPTAKLTIAGDGPWLERLKSQAEDLRLGDAVKFSGYVTGADKESLLRSHDIYVVPSIITDNGDAEGLPVSLMEGLAAGKICIATNESGADDFIKDGDNGLLIPQKDTNALTEALVRAAQLSVEERAAISSRAQMTARQFSWDTIASTHINFLFSKDLNGE
jgi:glycosyltransferase involved in cell wall biosynthesis